MKLLYGLMLLFGLLLETPSYVRNRAIDTPVVSALSESPDSWTISLDKDLEKRLDGHDVKAAVILASGRCASISKDAKFEMASAGMWFIVFSTIALLREVKIDKLRRQLASNQRPEKLET